MCTWTSFFFHFHRRHSPTHETRASRWGLMRSKCPWKRVHMKVEKNMRPSLINKQERIFFLLTCLHRPRFVDDYTFFSSTTRDTSPLNRFMFHLWVGWGLKKSSELNSPVYLLLPLVAWNCVVEISEIISFPPFHYFFSVIFISIEISLICINLFL